MEKSGFRSTRMPAIPARSRNAYTSIAARASSTSPAAQRISTGPSKPCAPPACRSCRPPPDTYFEKIDARLPEHGEDVARLQRNGILIDGEGVVDGGHTKVL